jgi:hypothetical protein
MRILTTIGDVVSVLGGDTVVARWLDISQPAVANWKVRGQIPRGWHFRLHMRLSRMGYTIAPEVLGYPDSEMSDDPLETPPCGKKRAKSEAATVA